MIKYILVFLFSVFISQCSHILLKKSALKTYSKPINDYLNPYVISAYSMFFMSTILTMYSYRGVPLSFGVLLEASGYLYGPLLYYIFFKERMTKNRWIGAAFIIAGLCCYSLL